MKLITLLLFALLTLLSSNKIEIPKSLPRTITENKVYPKLPPLCEIRGAYTGYSHTNRDVISPMTYFFSENNFTKGSKRLTDPIVTYGGYRYTCDSIFLSVFYTENNCYYLLKGAVCGNTIVGTYENLTTPSDYGTFSISSLNSEPTDITKTKTTDY